MRLPWGSADKRLVSLKLTRKPQSNQANASQWRMFGKCDRPITKTLGQGLPRRTPGGAATSDPAEDNRVVSPETVPTCSACPGATRRRRTAHRALGES